MLVLELHEIRMIHKVSVWLTANIGTVFRDLHISPSGVFPMALL